MLLLLTAVSLAAGRSDTNLQSANQIKSSPFKVCIDDSDCAHMEGKYGCFQYICYPYEDDSLISAAARKTKCTRNDECGANQVCHRHPSRRHINTGLCMDELGDCREHGDNDCKSPGGSERRCCNGQFCCEEEYFNQLANLPCVNHEMCMDLGYGSFCCPTKESNGTTSVCCDTNPNPPPTLAPPQQAGSITGAAAQTLVETAILALAAVLLVALA